MGKILVLAEKPSVGRELARVLGCKQKGNGYIEGNKYIVTWALGHLVTLADPEAYDNKYKTWNMEQLPMLPNRMKTIVIGKTSKQFNAVKGAMTRGDIDELVIATDAGREGELVARWIIEKVHFNKPIKRLWISSQTDKAIKEGFAKLKDGREYENLYKSAVSRSEADWLVGLNVTRALTCKFNAQLSAGRVQTPTLGMIVQREEEIKNFKPKTYYTIEATTDKFKLTWQDSRGNNRIFNENECSNVLSKLKGKEGKIVEVKNVPKKTYAPKLYDLTELQRDANRIWGYSAKQTLSIMQRLYENYKVLTYPRTDSRYISTDIVDTLKDRLKAISVGPYKNAATKVLAGKIQANKSFVDNSKVSDHHAIIPTEERASLASLSSEEKNIYDLVVKRFLSVLYPPFEYIQTSILAKVEGETLIARGKVTKALGWKEVYTSEDFDDDEEGNNEIKEQNLPVVTEGEVIKVLTVNQKKGETKPPARFNEGTLLSAMENPLKYMNTANTALKKAIGETGGLGTVATRADIIEKLYNTFYIEKKGKEIHPTSKGKQLIDLVPEDLKSPMLTAEWEVKLEKISKGKLNYRNFIEEMRQYATKLVDDVKGNNEKYVHDNMTRAKCPECGKYLLEVNGKKGKMLVCQDRDCGYRKGLGMISNIQCPECRKKMEIRGEGEGKILVCPKCSHREKYSSYIERKKKEGSKTNKKDVQNYMRKQKKENDGPVNSALADALAKLNLKK